MKTRLETLDSCGLGTAPKASLSKSTPSSPSLESNSKLNKPKKKRVRREKVELDSLRLESRKLQIELAQLREIYKHQQGETRVENDAGANPTKLFAHSSAQQKFRLIAPQKIETIFVWQRIAEHQLKERWRAQNQNRELRERLLAEYEVGRQLAALLLRQSKMKICAVNRRYNTPLANDDAVVESHLAQAENALAEMHMVLRGSAYRDPTACFVHAQMKMYGATDAFIMQSNMTLPFPARVTGSALWRVMGTERLKNQCYDHRILLRSDTVLSQDFKLRFTMDKTHGDVHCKYTLCKFDIDGHIVLIWVAQYDSIEINALRYHNVQGCQVGWIEVKSQEVAGIQTTLARSYSRLTLEGGNYLQTKLQVRTLFSLAQPIHEKVGVLCSSLIEEALIEEDCKLNEV